MKTSQQTPKNIVNQPILCLCCKTFYASETFQGLCSTCFKQYIIQGRKNKTSENHQNVKQTTNAPQLCQNQSIKPQQNKPVKAEQSDKSRCYTCRKKVGLLGIQCQCGFFYCNTHRLPEQHSCNVDFGAIAKEKLQKEIIKVQKGKVPQI